MKAITIGRLLARRRREAGLTQAEVAARMGTSQAAISRLESGQAMPSLPLLDRYATALGRPIEIMFGQPETSPSREERRRRVEAVLGKDPFDPWERMPAAAEARSLMADGLTRERFESQGTARPR